ncbi:MAG: 30S ribosomal protein S12 methylthiotransferase RimO [Terracidiphilus sp.]|nr:30S ribosomal protein S12 methylthiotransferase RimO [Terracidiphilus sp.]MDR3775565.1 30S ribosomal protein S12 methylthiotransferase RimO [Terracidiphilus sp.]
MSKNPLPTAPSVGFISLGCPKNLVDSEVMMGLLDRAGARLTNHPEEAEILIVNTCSFIDTAKQESIDTILEMARHKTSGSAKKLIVAGCLVERYRDEIRKSIPEVDAVVGTGELDAILEAAGLAPMAASTSPFTILSGSVDKRPGQESQSGTHKATHEEASSRPEGDLREQQGRFRRDDWEGATHLLPTYLYDETTPRFLTTPKSSAYIKIAEGCDHPCTFCVIPNLRGKFRSRRFESVVAEARQLVAQGVEEITLIGQDTTCYGEDLGLKDGLALLLDELAVIPGLRWLRFLYAYPNRVTTKLLETIARHDNICKYLDLPLQHAAPAVLKRMKRGGSGDIFLKTLEKVRATVPGIALRTSFIVGFPGETAEDITALEDFVKEAKFDWLGVFSYSDEEGSGAFPLDRKVPKRSIEARKRRLMKLQQAISKKAKQQWVGRELVLLAEGESEETPLLWEARTQFHAPEIDGKVYINDFGDLEALEPGRFYNAVITEAHEYDVVARVVSAAL